MFSCSAFERRRSFEVAVWSVNRQDIVCSLFVRNPIQRLSRMVAVVVDEMSELEVAVDRRERIGGR